MIKIDAGKLQQGMRLAKPILNRAGIVLLSEGTELTESWIRRVQDMDLGEGVFIEGKAEMDVPLDEMIAALEKRFQISMGNPHMETIKKAAEKHIRKLYE
ncbi:MAG TPA: hypothetical protein DDY17_10195 [Syntrophaceae bacterium]|jgi:hypothetical protein|nr:hypothetical protein [Syntrophaceae bacterium]